jgi:hypothetical protein
MLLGLRVSTATSILRITRYIKTNEWPCTLPYTEASQCPPTAIVWRAYIDGSFQVRESHSMSQSIRSNGATLSACDNVESASISARSISDRGSANRAVPAPGVERVARAGINLSARDALIGVTTSAGTRRVSERGGANLSCKGTIGWAVDVDASGAEGCP